jgi:predicted nucleic acid-binding protein
LSVYADTSFLVSLYVLDSNSERAAIQIQQATLPILLTTFGELELTNAISLRLFRRELTPLKVKAVRALVHKDLVDGVLLTKPVTTSSFEKAMQMARRRTPQLGTRTLDILHVASALELKAEMFYTFDHSQARLARAEGLLVTPEI